MTFVQVRIGIALALTFCQLGCNDDDAAERPTNGQAQDAAVLTSDAAATTPDAAVPDGGTSSCTIASTCLDIDIPPLTAKACCTPTRDCGYTIPELDAETLMYYPQAREFFAMQVKDDPNGKCAPESFLLGSQPGFTEERYEDDTVPDILIAESCSAFHVGAFSLAGCCLPDNTCGLSTHNSAPTLGYLSGDATAPFARPECVHAEVLNEQFRNSKLRSLARTTSTGTCNYAEIDARQKNWF